MPIYEYQCECGKVFETLIVRRADEEDVICPRCGGRQVARLLSRTASPRTGGGSGAPAGGCGPVG